MGFGLRVKIWYNIPKVDKKMAQNCKFLIVCALSTLAFIAGAGAAPAVKVLGQKNLSGGAATSNIRAKTAKPSAISNSTQSPRIGSVRSVGSSVRPIGIQKPGANLTTSKSVSTPERLSIGKYLHGQGVTSGAIKTVGGGAATSSSDFISLSDRVADLENEKQDKLTAGNGITISEEKNSQGDTEHVISLSADFIENFNDKEGISHLVEFYYDKEAIDAMIQPMQQNNIDIHYSGTDTKLDTVEIVDTFSPSIFGGSGAGNEQNGD